MRYLGLYNDMKRYLMIGVIIMFSCSEEKRSSNLLPQNASDSLLIFQDEVSKIQPDSKNYQLESAIELHNTIYLETKTEAIPTHADFYDASEDIIIIKDRKENKVIIFDGSGKHIANIDDRGKGPDEYLYLKDVSLDADHKVIYCKVTVGADKSYFIYTYNTFGEKTGELQLPVDVKNMIYFENRIYTDSDFSSYTPDDCYNLNIFDVDGVRLHKLFPFKYRKVDNGSLQKHSTFSRCDDKLVYSPNLSNSYYLMKEDKIEYKIQFVNDENESLSDLRKKYKNIPISQFMKEISPFEFYNDVTVSPDVIIFSYDIEEGAENGKEKVVFVLFDRQDQEYYPIESFNINSTPKLLTLFPPDFYKDGYFYKSIEPEILVNNIELLHQLSGSESSLAFMERLLGDYSAIDNRIIVQYKINMDELRMEKEK